MNRRSIKVAGAPDTCPPAWRISLPPRRERDAMLSGSRRLICMSCWTSEWKTESRGPSHSQKLLQGLGCRPEDWHKTDRLGTLRFIRHFLWELLSVGSVSTLPTPSSVLDCFNLFLFFLFCFFALLELIFNLPLLQNFSCFLHTS